MIEADLVKGCGRGVGGNVSADAMLLPVGSHDHGQGVPAHQTLDAPLDLRAAGERRFLLEADAVDVRRVRGVRQPHPVALRVDAEVLQQALHPLGSAFLHHIVERLQPFPAFDRFNVGCRRLMRSSHSFSDSPCRMLVCSEVTVAGQEVARRIGLRCPCFADTTLNDSILFRGSAKLLWG